MHLNEMFQKFINLRLFGMGADRSDTILGAHICACHPPVYSTRWEHYWYSYSPLRTASIQNLLYCLNFRTHMLKVILRLINKYKGREYRRLLFSRYITLLDCINYKALKPILLIHVATINYF